MATHGFGFPRHDGFAPVEADDARRIIIACRPVAKHAATNGAFGPMSGGWVRSKGMSASPRDFVATPFLRKGV